MMINIFRDQIKAKMAPIELHGMAMSAPCRIVAMAAEMAGVEYVYLEVNPMNGDTRKPEFLALNPTHTIPTMKVGLYWILNWLDIRQIIWPDTGYPAGRITRYPTK